MVKLERQLRDEEDSDTAQNETGSSHNQNEQKSPYAITPRSTIQHTSGMITISLTLCLVCRKPYWLGAAVTERASISKGGHLRVVFAMDPDLNPPCLVVPVAMVLSVGAIAHFSFFFVPTGKR